MHFIVETKDQLDSLRVQSSCFLQLIPNNHNFHPRLAKACLYYYRNSEKGYMLCVDHSECFGIDNEHILDFIQKHETVYVLDKKYHSHFMKVDNFVDLSFSKQSQNDTRTSAQLEYEQKYQWSSELNSIIPVVKHYERLERVFDIYKSEMSRPKNQNLDSVISAYSYVESNPIKINKKLFFEKFKVNNEEASIDGDNIYNQYNLYNQTGRPTNSFNGINFLAIPKDREYRDCFLPSNDYLVEFDFDGYHLRLIGNEVGYEFKESSVHEYLGKQYFNKDALTEEEYKESKTISFKNLYGGVPEAYQHIEFFSAMVTLSKKLSQRCATGESMELPTGISITRDEDMYDSKLLNYYVQNLETKRNAEKILQLKDLLEGKKSKLVLITYDAFLFDYAVSDGKELLLKIKEVLEQDSMVVKHKHGKTYFL